MLVLLGIVILVSTGKGTVKVEFSDAEAARKGTVSIDGDAIRLVRQGAREARLVDELGLNPIEASLIVRLHGGCAAH